MYVHCKNATSIFPWYGERGVTSPDKFYTKPVHIIHRADKMCSLPVSSQTKFTP